MLPVKCVVCNTEFYIASTQASFISVECPSCGAKEELPNLESDGIYTYEEIEAHYNIVSDFNNQLLCEEKDTERLVSFLSCGNNKYRILG